MTVTDMKDTATDSVSIILADDHAMVRSSLRDRIEREPDMTVLAAVSTADEAVSKVDALRPDILLMDVDMPGTLCFDAARTLAARFPETRVVFLSARCHDRYIEQALDVKAWGYVTKSEPDHALIKAIRDVAAGATHFSPDVQARLVIDAGGSRLAHAVHARARTLTQRETEILMYVARGLSKKEIAHLANISVNTVNRHTSSIMTKLDIHDRVELARFAIREGLAEA